jgi:phosphatidylserine decarboxylase
LLIAKKVLSLSNKFNRQMKVHREGLNIIISTAAVLLLVNFLLYKTLWRSPFPHIFLPLSAAFFLMIVNFFRCPKRVLRNAPCGTVAAPADGRVVVVEEVEETEYFNDRRLQVSVFMSLLNAHVNWVPCEGRVTHYQYQAGRFQAAYLPKSSTENERSTIVIETPGGEQVMARQIAGAMAKRIVTYVEKGEECHINEQLGFIKFGSRVDLFLPIGTTVNVKIGDKVKGNKTIIATLGA